MRAGERAREYWTRLSGSVLAGECNEAASYWAPDLRTEAVEHCQKGIVMSAETKGRCRLTEYDIEKGVH